MKISCIIWDYDGTLADTRMKNLNVTKTILTKIIGEFDIECSVLNSVESYELANTRSVNWRDMYSREFGLNEEQIDAAGKMWTKVQSMDETDVQIHLIPLFLRIYVRYAIVHEVFLIHRVVPEILPLNSVAAEPVTHEKCMFGSMSTNIR